MGGKRFRLSARIHSDEPAALRSVLKRWFGEGEAVRSVADGFEVTAEVAGESARELNRRLLSELRRQERRTRLRAEWSSGDLTERFFDYVPKGVRRAGERA